MQDHALLFFFFFSSFFFQIYPSILKGIDHDEADVSLKLAPMRQFKAEKIA